MQTSANGSDAALPPTASWYAPSMSSTESASTIGAAVDLRVVLR
jgi:hypothetical protein